MKKRIESLARLAKLQARLHALKHARIVALERERTGLADELAAVFEALASGALAYGAQAKLSSQHPRFIEARMTVLEDAREETARQARAHALRARLAEQAAEAVGRRLRDANERKTLAEIAERAVARRRDASST